ncbi:MAG: diphosphate--fructose-6-phosphate 1-phosphotransferase [Candidatus Faecousia sp.]|nr:diphosphate--fructose-6-phosphate 1-phosphotransferase [Candidatus Faecousia sp.]
MAGNLIIVHGGGPTAVINSSLYGAIRQAQESPEVDRVLVAIGGTGGLLKEHIKDVTDYPDESLRGLLTSPASAIGTSRDALEKPEYEAMVPILQKHNIRYVLMNGGNGTMDTCGKLYAQCAEKGISVIGIPKTMDNDLAVTDHAPGFGSAARYVAGSTAELCCDVEGLPIHVVVLETSGRNAGWLTAAASLATDSYAHGPDLIYLPERDFDQEAFLRDVKKLIEEKGHGVVVASEGLHYAGGTPIVEPIFTVGRATYFGDVGSHLANLIIKELGYKARAEKPGLLGRASMLWQSETDREEAERCGRAAVDAATAGESGKMVALRRCPGEGYRCETFLVDIREVMMTERKLPDEFINAEGNGITEAFRQWCRPLLGSPLPKLMDLR